MITFDMSTGKFEMHGNAYTVGVEIGLLIKGINDFLDNEIGKPESKIIEESAVYSDIPYEEFCKFASRLHAARKRLEETQDDYK